jgi:hypothetical protein
VTQGDRARDEVLLEASTTEGDVFKDDQAGGLGTLASIVTPHLPGEPATVDPPTGEVSRKLTQADLQAKRYELRDVAGDLLPGERVATCGRYVVPGETYVDVKHIKGTQTAYYENLETCSSVWTCPVCSSKINQERRGELRQAMEHAKAHGLHPYLVTFTMQHERRDSLAVLIDALKDSLRRLKRGAPWQRFRDKYGIAGYVTAFEVTHGRHGWHPHVHMLFFADHKPSEDEAWEEKVWLWHRFDKFLQKHHGRYCSGLHGVDVRTGAAVDYVTKWGLDAELTGGEFKSGHGRTPFQLLASYKDGNKQDGVLFREYAEAVKGTHQLQWSRGLKDLLEVEPGEDPDPDQDIETVMTLTRKQWSTVCKAQARGDLLRVAALGDPELCWTYLKGIGVEPDIGRAVGDRPPPRDRNGPRSSGGAPYAVGLLAEQLERTEILRDVYERGMV